MRMNKIFVRKPLVENNKIVYKFDVEGECKDYFNEKEFFIEYSENIGETVRKLA